MRFRRAIYPSRLFNISLSPPLVIQARTNSSTSCSPPQAHRGNYRKRYPHTSSDILPPWSAQEAVSNILYETPSPSSDPSKRHILNCLVQNEPGVLSRISGILAARGFNIDSLVVCSTEVEDLSRMTIVLNGQEGVVEQARRQLEDLVPVWAVINYSNTPLVQRELLLAKINILGPEYFEELQAHHREITMNPAPDQLSMVESNFHPRKMPISEALRHKHEHLKSITYLAHQFGGKVLDISNNSCIVEISAKPSRIDSFMKLIAPFGILESARTGLMALPRSPLHAPNDSEQIQEVNNAVDTNALPPG